MDMPVHVPVLSLTNVTKRFGRPDGSDRLLPGCHDISLDLKRGETIGIVGESGSGKTTLGRCIVGLQDIDSGDIRVGGEPIGGLCGSARRHFRRTVQIVFQNPETSLNPRMTAGRFVAEALRNFSPLPPVRERKRLIELAELVGLREEHLNRHPHELSGGQKQRFGLMRALACEPEIIVLDEPTSALDVSVQAQVLRTLREVQARTSVAFILISHDVGVIRYMCSRVFVMYLGRVVEAGAADAVLSSPRHPYTRALIDAVPRIRRVPKPAFQLAGDATLRRVSASACPLLPRCPSAMDRCRSLPPVTAAGPGHTVACWLNVAGDHLPEAATIDSR